MPVRTSAVVAVGLGLLTVLGVAAIFGDSIVALVAPPPLDTASAAASGPRQAPHSTTATAPAIPSAPGSTTPHATQWDAGAGSPPDSSS